MSATVQIDFGGWIQKGFDLYKNNFVLLLLVNLIAMAIGIFSATVLMGPMMAGVVLITLVLLDGRSPKPEIGDVFKGFGFFLPAFLLVLLMTLAYLVGSFILNLLPCIGFIFSLVYGLVLSAFLPFALFNIVDKKMDVWPAIQASIDLVKPNLVPFLGLAIIASLIGHVGAVLCGIGALVTMPMYWCIMAVAYREMGKDADPVITVEAERVQ